MRYLAIIIIFLLSMATYAGELKINYEVDPNIFIYFPDELNNKSFEMESDGKVIWIGHTPTKLTKDGQIDWDQFHIDARNNRTEIKFSKKEYEHILKLCIEIIEKYPITNKSHSGPGYKAFVIDLGESPMLDYRFGSKGMENFPEEIFALSKYIKENLSPNQPLKAQPSAAGTPQSGAP